MLYYWPSQGWFTYSVPALASWGAWLSIKTIGRLGGQGCCYLRRRGKEGETVTLALGGSGYLDCLAMQIPPTKQDLPALSWKLEAWLPENSWNLFPVDSCLYWPLYCSVHLGDLQLSKSLWRLPLILILFSRCFLDLSVACIMCLSLM